MIDFWIFLAYVIGMAIWLRLVVFLNHKSGKVDFDELHAYVNSALLDVAVTGLGKRPMPRRTYISTQGNVRDGPLDRYMTAGLKVLEGTEPDKTC